MKKLAAVCALATVLAVLRPIVLSLRHAATAATLSPNVILILTDDQVIDTLQKMPHVLDLAAQGTS
ncbi:MAG: hypothetical protein ACHQAW_06200, partial [Actinomycetota bacterium]